MALFAYISLEDSYQLSEALSWKFFEDGQETPACTVYHTNNLEDFLIDLQHVLLNQASPPLPIVF